MDFLTLRFASYGSLLIFCLCPFWRTSDCRNLTDGSTSVSTRALKPPVDVKKVTVVDQTESHVTIEFDKVVGINEYRLNYSINGKDKVEHIPWNTDGPVRHTLNGLMPAQKYKMTLRSKLGDLQSNGYSFNATTAPRAVSGFEAQRQSETSITLQWDKVADIQDYLLQCGTWHERVNVSSGALVTHHVTNLQSGTLYNFTLYAEFANLLSRGISCEAPTVPPQVSSVKTERTLTTITLQWESGRKDWNYLVDFGGNSIGTLTQKEDFVSFSVKSLKPGFVYSFSIVTEFQSLNSTTFKNITTTVIDCTKVDWQVTETSIRGEVEGEFTDATASNGSQLHHNSGSSNVVQFTDLYPGANYSMKLLYNGLEQCNYALNIIPPSLTARCRNWDAGYSIYMEWDRPRGVWDSVEISVSNEVHKVGYNGELYAEIPNFHPAKTYQVSICTLSGPQRSSSFVFTCATDARGVIAGAFVGVLLSVVLVCVVVFVVLKRHNIISKQKKSLNDGSKISVKTTKWIPLEKFPGHFNELSADENKGFSLEFEDLANVGTEQTQKAARKKENEHRNRCMNVLPYDQSRVKLASSFHHSDYINASYMPGYNSDREFIATQGPLLSTVNDFWRMIWEQEVRGIVMVTNCIVGDRTKCEQYWSDSNPRVCGELEVFTTSEQKEANWTLREFKVKQRRTLVERTVRQFHFTAWPYHRVPQKTLVLVQFSALVRRHLQTEAAETPIVVHSSAGVGAAGTFIALDMLLQQMEKEKAVDITGFVRKMRLNRPHMVQTESQYVFLHQCIMDLLLLKEKQEEHIYENDSIYANATALREVQNNMHDSKNDL